MSTVSFGARRCLVNDTPLCVFWMQYSLSRLETLRTAQVETPMPAEVQPLQMRAREPTPVTPNKVER